MVAVGVACMQQLCLYTACMDMEHETNRFDDASGTLRSRNHSVIASFLDLQLPVSDGNELTVLTMLAPGDSAMKGRIGNFCDFPALFFRHMLPCRVSRADLVSFGNGMRLRTLLDGELLVNGVVVTLVEIYSSDWLVVPGIRDVLVASGRPSHGKSGSATAPSPQHRNYNSQNTSPSPGLKPPISPLFSAQ